MRERKLKARVKEKLKQSGSFIVEAQGILYKVKRSDLWRLLDRFQK